MLLRGISSNKSFGPASPTEYSIYRKVELYPIF